MFRQDATGHPGTTCRTRRQVPVVDGQATVFLSFHRAGEASGFTAFAEAVAADAAVAAGFCGWRLSVLTSPLLDWAIAVAFDDQGHLHDWMDRARDLLVGAPYLRLGMELFVDGVPRTPGVLLVRDVAQPGRVFADTATAENLARVERAQPGYEGSAVFPPAPHQPTWSSIIRFRTEAQLNAWLASADLTRALPDRAALLSQESHATTATSFGSTVRITDGHAAVTPSWKTAMMIQLILYPAHPLLRAAALARDVHQSRRQHRAADLGAHAVGASRARALARSGRGCAPAGEPRRHGRRVRGLCRRARDLRLGPRPAALIDRARVRRSPGSRVIRPNEGWMNGSGVLSDASSDPASIRVAFGARADLVVDRSRPRAQKIWIATQLEASTTKATKKPTVVHTPFDEPSASSSAAGFCSVTSVMRPPICRCRSRAPRRAPRTRQP